MKHWNRAGRATPVEVRPAPDDSGVWGLIKRRSGGGPRRAAHLKAGMKPGRSPCAEPRRVRRDGFSPLVMNRWLGAPRKEGFQGGKTKAGDKAGAPPPAALFYIPLSKGGLGVSTAKEPAALSPEDSGRGAMPPYNTIPNSS